MRARAHYAFLGAVLVGCGGVASGDQPHRERVGAAASPIIYGAPSTSSEDFVVFVASASKGSAGGADATASCGGALVAPNLVLTAKHCVYAFVDESKSICDASGEPQIGAPGGFVTGTLPDGDVGIYPGVDGRKRFVDKLPPAAVVKRIVDDETPTLCSHDLAYVVLDRPITDVPLAKLRLSKRPEAGPEAKLALAGWGFMENREGTVLRMRRGGINIQRVGPPAPPLDATGSLGPRTFETGPGGCKGDSGSPGMDDQTGAVLGVLARALNTDPSHPVSPCAPESVINVYMTVADFTKPLRTAFAAAEAEPWLEGRDAPGYLRFGETCASNLECEGNLCAGAAESKTGTCNVDCAVSGQTCPVGYACDAGICVQSAVPPPAQTSNVDVDAGEQPPSSGLESAFRVGGGGCNSTNSNAGSHGTAVRAIALAACALVVSRIRMRRRSRH